MKILAILAIPAALLTSAQAFFKEEHRIIVREILDEEIARKPV